MPIFFTQGAAQAPLLIVAHATSLSMADHLIASLRRHGLQAAITGNGTSWHWFEDKLMGLKTVLLQLEGDPVVMFVDSSDVLCACGEAEILRRFQETGAEMLIGGESQLWPEVAAYFSMAPVLARRDEMLHLGSLGRIKDPAPASPGTDSWPHRWANGGTFMGTKQRLLEYFDAIEGYLAPAAQGDGDGFARECPPYKAEQPAAGGFFDDQACLNRFLMETAAKNSTGVKLDADGSLFFSVGGWPLTHFQQDENGKVYWTDTQKSPCIWHFNNPLSKKKISPIIKQYPGYFV